MKVVSLMVVNNDDYPIMVNITVMYSSMNH